MNGSFLFRKKVEIWNTNLFMKKILSLWLIAVVGLLAFNRFNELPIGASMPKPDYKMKDAITGKEVSLNDTKKENGLLVMFSCNTCPYVIKNQERTNDICKYALDNKIGVILINSNEGQRGGDDSYDAMKDYAKEQGYNWYYVVDKNSELADAFSAKRTPENFLFNKDGKLIYHGAIDDNPSDAGNIQRKHLREAIGELVNGKDVTVKTSRSIGCTIKRL